MTQTTVQEYKHLRKQLRKFKDLSAPIEILDSIDERIKVLQYTLPDYCKEDKILYLRTIALDDSNLTFVTDSLNKDNVFIIRDMFRLNRQPHPYFNFNHLMSAIPRDTARLLMLEKMESGYELWLGKVKKDWKTGGNPLLISKDKNDPKKRFYYNKDLIESFRTTFDLLDGVRIDLVQVNEIL